MTKTKSAPKKAAPKKAAQVNAGTQAYTDWVMDYIGLAKPMEPTRIDLILQGVNSISERLALLEQNAPSAAETLKAELRSISDRIDALRMEQYAISGAKKVPKFGDRVITPNGEGRYWYAHGNGVHTVIFAEGGQSHYITSQLTPIKP